MRFDSTFSRVHYPFPELRILKGVMCVNFGKEKITQLRIFRDDIYRSKHGRSSDLASVSECCDECNNMINRLEKLHWH